MWDHIIEKTFTRLEKMMKVLTILGCLDPHLYSMLQDNLNDLITYHIPKYVEIIETTITRYYINYNLKKISAYSAF